MRGEEPFAIAKDENVSDLHDGFVKSLGEGGGDASGACDPTDGAFYSNTDPAESHSHAAGIGENTRPAFANFVPTE